MVHTIDQLLKALRHEKDTKQRKKLKKKVAHQYIQFGEFLKLGSKPDPVMAKRYLEKALTYDPDNPLAHYRLAHLYFNDGDYHMAAFHFYKALYEWADIKLNDIQKLVSQMLLINCGIEIALEALKEYEKNSSKHLFNIDENLYQENLIERFEKELYLSKLNDLKRGLYRIITPENDSIVTEEKYFAEQDGISANEVMLVFEKGRYTGDDRLTIHFRHEMVELDYKDFYLLSFLLHSEEPLTNDDIQKNYLEKFLHEESKPDAIRKWFQRLREKISFWDDIIEETTNNRKTGRKRKAGISYRIFCRASDTFPWEVLDEFHR